MKYVTWQSKFEIGDELFDVEHRQLFEKINNCIGEARHGAHRQDLITQLEEILGCFDMHFEHEERTLLKKGHPDFRRHRAQHQHLIERLKSEIKELANVNNKQISAQDILFVLYDWYVAHLGEDQKILIVNEVGNRFVSQ